MNPAKHRIPAVLAVTALMLTGCAVPIAVSIASYSFDGLAYVATDKSVTDLALSQAADRDCSMFRILRGKDVCRDYTPEQRHDMAIAYAEANNYVGVSRRSSEPTYALVRKRSEEELVAEVDRAEAEKANRASASIATLDKKGPPQATIAFAAGGSPDIQVVPLAPLAGPKHEVLPVAASTPAVAHATPLPLPVPKPVMTAAARPALPRGAAARPASEARAEGAYLVLASFSSRAHAESGLALYAAAKPRVAVTTVGGKEMYRVVSGPYSAKDLAKARARLAKSYDLSKSWSLPGATASPSAVLRRPAGDLELASLPGRI